MTVQENRAKVGSACCKCVKIKIIDLIPAATQDSATSWKGTKNVRCENGCIFDSSSAW